MPNKAARARTAQRQATKAASSTKKGQAKASRRAQAPRAGASRAPVRASRAPTSIKPAPRVVTAARPLTKRELEEFRQLLEEERDRLTQELEAIEEHLPEVEQISVDSSGYDEDIADVAADTFEREKGFAIENSVQALLTQVEEALSRIDEGTYGTCELCGQPIHIERLRAIPYARLCIQCKAREEQANAR
ncbi:MAG: TraR/DksA C4-type zinc finger protein [Armatimonadota bacterium]|nr:TraR/DksA C4-type zinc finger protein [Armatimonadota bacterium]